MPLPHFLLMLVVVIVAALLTIWAAVSVGVPIAVLGVLLLIAAMLAHLAGRIEPRQDRHHSPDGS